MASSATNSARLKELKPFDDTKAGVKGLVDEGVSKVPSIFLRSPDDFDNTPPPSLNTDFKIPTINLERAQGDPEECSQIVEELRRACATWGFFYVVNHGIPMDVLDEMTEGVRRFHELPKEEKSVYYTRDSSKAFVYNSNFDLFKVQRANWRDTVFCVMAPDSPDPDDLPEVCRDILMEFSKHVTALGFTLFELLSEVLGLKPDHLQNLGCAEGLAVLCHYYPACPEPELTLGASKHTDGDFLTVLLQDQIGGLQILCQDQWVDVPPVRGGLVINIGDLLQLISNDKFKSSKHRVVANKRGPRISVACFFSTQLAESNRLYGPIKELVSEENPPKYRETTVREVFQCKRPGWRTHPCTFQAVTTSGCLFVTFIFTCLFTEV